MKLLVGLGNPGPRYAESRHNAGFLVAERFAERLGIGLSASHYGGRFGTGSLEVPDADPVPVAVLEPQTFMNRSGESVASAVRGLEISDPASELLLVFDDVDLPFGRMRIRPRGGAGGHRGVESAIERLGREDFQRLRFGVGRPDQGQETRDHVLGPFSDEEGAALDGLLERASEAVQAVFRDGCTAAMNVYNRAPDGTVADDDD